eukprot:scaffold7870_cov100-Isochrysis_galbana.AAC.1
MAAPGCTPECLMARERRRLPAESATLQRGYPGARGSTRRRPARWCWWCGLGRAATQPHAECPHCRRTSLRTCPARFRPQTKRKGRAQTARRSTNQPAPPPADGSHSDPPAPAAERLSSLCVPVEQVRRAAAGARCVRRASPRMYVLNRRAPSADAHKSAPPPAVAVATASSFAARRSSRQPRLLPPPTAVSSDRGVGHSGNLKEGTSPEGKGR